ncbi:MAG: hypothetical protein Q8Q09_01355 [Deltaproteobacteria bacterium]|nr:hypothetical protein [Deltaproteobacteria bacterium]
MANFPPVEQYYRRPPRALITDSVIEIRHQSVGQPELGNVRPCFDLCDACVQTSSTLVNGEPVLDEPTCCVPAGSRCNVDDDCCDFGTNGASCVLDPSTAIPSTQSAPARPPIKICRRGCRANLIGNLLPDICRGVFPPNPAPPSGFVCPAPTECRPLPRPPFGGLPFFGGACVPCGHPGELACIAPGREGCTVILNQDVAGGGLVRLGNLRVDPNGVCVQRTDCGFPGGPCCPPDVRLCGPPGRLPQGGRCNGTNVCNSEGFGGTCVPCGASFTTQASIVGTACCEGSLVALNALSQQQARPGQGNNICNAARNMPPRRSVDLRCPGDRRVPAISPPRCNDGADTVCPVSSDPYSGTRGTCQACGGTGQPCCEGSLCLSNTDTCNPENRCEPCGGPNERCCRCPGTSGELGTDGCRVAAPDAQVLACVPNSGRCVGVTN